MHVLQTLKSVQADNGVVLIDTGSEKITVEALLPQVVRVRFIRGHQWEIGLPESPAVILKPQAGLTCRVRGEAVTVAAEAAVAAEVQSLDAAAGTAAAILDENEIILPGQERRDALEQEEIEVEVGDLVVKVEQKPLRLSFYDRAGNLILQEAPQGGVAHDGWRVAARWALRADERLFGLGETEQRIPGPIAFNHRGEVHRLEHNHLPNPARMVLPFVISSAGYGLFVDNTFPATWDLGATDGETLSYVADAGMIDYYLMVGSPYEVLDQYTQLTGRPAMPPRWMFGYMQSKFGYRSSEEVEALVETFREKEIPIDAVALDLYWFKYMGDMCWDEAAFPNPKEFTAKLKSMGVKILAIQEPYLVTSSRLFPIMKAKGMLAHYANGEAFTFPFWTGDDAALVDFSNPAARKFWSAQHKPLVESGIAGWWLDLTEPEVHYPMMIHHGGPAQAMHNTEGFRMQQTVHDALLKYAPNQRPAFMSRSSWSGSQRFGLGLWSGDIATTFKALADQIPLGLSTGLAGFPLWNTDIGGFMGDEPTPELYVRWMQFGAFTPVMRPHGAQQVREPWQFGAEAEEIVTEYIRLRYRLIPYIYTYAAEAFRTGSPYMRPLVLEFPADPNVAELRDQYLFGRELLVAPVVEEGATARQVYLPAGTWFDFHTGKPVAGGRTITVDAPLATLPLFVRGGSVLPLGEVTPTTDAPVQQMTFRLYGAGGSFTLYEDDGQSLGYRKGQYAETTVSTRLEQDLYVVEVGAAHGTYAKQLPARTVVLEAYDMAEPKSVTLDGAAVRRVPAITAAGLGYAYDAENRRLSIKLPAAKADRVVLIY